MKKNLSVEEVKVTLKIFFLKGVNCFLFFFNFLNYIQKFKINILPKKEQEIGMSKNLMLYISLMSMPLSFYNNIFHKITQLTINSKFMLLAVLSKKLAVNN